MRVLFVCMPSSVHAARWVGQLNGLGWELHVYGSIPAHAHAGFEEVTIHGFSRYRPPGLSESVRLQGVWPLRRGVGLIGERFAGLEPRRLARLIERLKPDVVHSLELQHAGYLTLAARGFSDRFPPWIVTNWGSDIYWFSRFPEHERRLRLLLASCDFYACECERDVGLAHALGLRGEVISVSPAAGGLDLGLVARMRTAGPVSARRLIMVKGYEFWPGRGLVALRALELARDALGGYEILVTSAAPVVRNEVARLASGGLSIAVAPRLPHHEMLRLYGRARIALALSVSDGLNTSALEALALGAFPIQSNTSCLGEWVTDGESGFLVEPDDPQEASRALRRALTDDALVDRAAALNAQTADARLDRRMTASEARAIYERASATMRP